jgi:hypothetical protein
VGPYLPIPTRRQRRDTWVETTTRLRIEATTGFVHEPPQPPTGALGDLAVLLEGPPEPGTELRAVHLKEDLGPEHEPLIGSEPGGDLRYTPQLQAAEDEWMQLRAGVRNLELPLAGPTKRKGSLERGLHGAAPTNGTEAVVDTGEEALLEGVGDVGAAGEPLPAAGTREQLEHGLAEAVLEVLGPQEAAMGAEQPRAPSPGNERDLLGGVGRRRVRRRRVRRPRARRRRARRRRVGADAAVGGGPRGREWGRHAEMSLQPTRRPPRQIGGAR